MQRPMANSPIRLTTCVVCGQPLALDATTLPTVWLGNGGYYCAFCGSDLRNQKRTANANSHEQEGGHHGD